MVLYNPGNHINCIPNTGQYCPYPAATDCYQYNPWTHKVTWNCDPAYPSPPKPPVIISSNIHPTGASLSNYPASYLDNTYNSMGFPQSFPLCQGS
ncbi:hypothetical protein EB796_007282 [Bugula neritina]|uniref:Uncharacterized protein n=1 Tax=Bugula neritina TaxID=10212 RepID=A0A7J7K700_BUGNE|nr:hypothetical protein EB796_007282 [Bugula neritina]